MEIQAGGWLLQLAFGAFLLVVCFASDVPYEDRSVSAEKRLLKDLLGFYKWMGTMGRPVHNISQPVVVHFGLGLIQLDLNEQDKVLTLSMWTRYQWQDEYLRWDPGQYENLTAIHLDPDLIWRPDIRLYNTADLDTVSRDALAVVTPDGAVSWFPHTIFHSSCSVDVTNYPFDEQECHMWFGSWTHPSVEIDLYMGNPDGIDLSTFRSDHKESCAWEINNVTGMRRAMPSEEENPHFIVLTFDISMTRKLVFASYMLTLPCVFLACLTLVVFWLPADRPDRTALAMSTFASFMFLLLLLVEAAPPTAGSVPTLGVYYCFNMVIIMLAIILSSLVVNVSRGCKVKVPKWLSVITSWRRICAPCRRRPENHTFYSASNIEKAPTEAYRMVSRYDTPAPSGLANGFQPHHPADKYGTTYTSAIYDQGLNSSGGRSVPSDRSTTSLNGVEAQVTEISQSLHRLEQVLQRRGDVTEEDFNKKEWRRISVVMDRFFFVFFILLIALSLAILFPRPI